VNRVARLLPVICTVGISGISAGDPPPQPVAAAPPQTVVQPPAAAPAGTSTAEARPVANKAGRKVLVDDTVTDAQLKQILRKGFKPASQGRGNEVYYCRSEQELGSHFETKVCKTAAQILHEERGSKDATADLERTGGDRALDKH
jgi:hypothetical protein